MALPRKASFTNKTTRKRTPLSEVRECSGPHKQGYPTGPHPGHAEHPGLSCAVSGGENAMESRGLAWPGLAQIPAHLHLARPGCQNTGWWVGAWATRSTGGSQGRQTPGSPLCQAGDGHPKSALGETAGPASAEHLAGQPEYLQGDNMAMARVPWWQGQGYTEMQRLRQGGHVQGS